MKSRQQKSGQQLWEPGETLNHLHQVWTYIKVRIPELRERLQSIRSQYYGYHQKTTDYDMEICRLLHSTTTNSHDIVSKVVKGDVKRVNGKLVDWVQTMMQSRDQLEEIQNLIKTDINGVLMEYCSDYSAIGMTAGDRLFTLFRSKMMAVPRILSSASDLIHYLKFSTIPIHLSGVAADSLQCECEGGGHMISEGGHMITKFIPLTIEFLEEALDFGYDWVVSDQLYIDELKDTIKKSRKELSELEKKLRISKAMQKTASSVLKEDQTVLEALVSERKSFDLKEISSAEKELRQTKLEIVALERAVRSAQEELEDLDVPDCFTEESCFGESSDIFYYEQRLAVKRQRLKHLTGLLEDYKNLKKELVDAEKKVTASVRRLKEAKKKRGKLAALRDSANDKVVTLDELYQRRVQPLKT